MTQAAQALPLGLGDRVRNWREVLSRGNLSEGRPIDPVSRWLIITRASVLPMTLTSGIVGGLLAWDAPGASFACFVLSLVGLVSAHLTNNLMNDYFDLEGGVDTEGYPRTLYMPHPVVSGWLTQGQLFRVIVGANVVGLAVLLVLTAMRGWPIVAFGIAGFLISFFYVAPPVRLKHRGLGEPAVVVVWGPLMICGTYYATAGALPGWVWAASIPYAILVGTVLVGKHIDKLPFDRDKGVRTLPVILGETTALRMNEVLMISFYPVIFGLVVSGVLGPGVLLVFLSLPLLVKVLRAYRDPKPARPPEGYRIWPLWYVAAAFLHTRRAGGLFVLGMLVDRALGIG